MKHWRREEIPTLLSLKEAGLTCAQIAAHFPGRSANGVQAKLERLGHTNPVRPWTQEELLHAKRRRAEGAPTKTIARELGRGWYTTRNKISQFPRHVPLAADKTVQVTDKMYENLADYAAARGIMKALALNEILEEFFYATDK